MSAVMGFWCRERHVHPSARIQYALVHWHPGVRKAEPMREHLMLVMERAYSAAVRDGRIPTRGTDEYFLILADAILADQTATPKEGTTHE